VAVGLGLGWTPVPYIKGIMSKCLSQSLSSLWTSNIDQAEEQKIIADIFIESTVFEPLTF